MPAPLLLHAFSTFAVGGAQVRFAAIANHFGSRWRHMIVAMDGNLACRERLDPSLDVQFPKLSVRKGDTVHNVRLFHRLLRDVRPTALVTSNWGTIEWAIANRWTIVPHVHTEDGFGPEERTRQIPRRVWMRRLALGSRTVVVPSRTLLQIARNTWRLNPAHVRCIPNGINLGRFASARPDPWLGSGPVIGSVAALRSEKNLARLIEAFAIATKTRPARLLVIGDGPERPRLEALAVELGVGASVRFAGHTPDPSSMLRGLDIFAMSSDTEQMPISLLEAMAAGLPVAATDVGDIAEMLPMEQRSLVVGLTAAALADALGALIGDGERRKTLGALNRVHVEAEFTQEKMFGAWADEYDEAARQKRR